MINKKSAHFYTDEVKDNDKIVKRFILEINNHRIILSNPQIQPFHLYEYKSPKDIMYFYHNFVIEQNTNYISRENVKEEMEADGEDVSPHWKILTEVFVYEDSTTRHLPSEIENVLNYNIRDSLNRKYFKDFDGQTSETDFMCEESFNLSGFCEEDNFVITKCCRYFDSSYNPDKDIEEPKYIEYYKMFFGCGQIELNYNIAGFYAFLEEEDMKEIQKWSSSFLDYAGELTRQQIEAELNDLTIHEFYCPGIVKAHLDEKYPEDAHRYKEIFKMIETDDLVSEEYYHYCVGDEFKPLHVHRDKIYVAEELIDSGMKDWEAYALMAKKMNE